MCVSVTCSFSFFFSSSLYRFFRVNFYHLWLYAVLMLQRNRWMFIYTYNTWLYYVDTMRDVILWRKTYSKQRRTLCKNKTNRKTPLQSEKTEQTKEREGEKKHLNGIVIEIGRNFSLSPSNRTVKYINNKSIFFFFLFNLRFLCNQNEFLFLFYCGWKINKINRPIMPSSAHSEREKERTRIHWENVRDDCAVFVWCGFNSIEI